MRVLVTGCAGYIGSKLVGELLADETTEYEVVGVDSLVYKSEAVLLPYLLDRFEFHDIDIRDQETMGAIATRCDAVIHLAALVGAPLCDSRPEETLEVNHRAAVQLAKRAQHARFIYLNSNSGYGQTDGVAECTEESPMNPISLYGKTKANAEVNILSDHQKAVSLRLATVFGASPRMRFDLLVNDFASRLELGRFSGAGPLQVYEPHFCRNFVGVRDVCRAINFMLKNQLSGPYNLGLPSANLTKMELAHTVCDVLGLSRQMIVEGEGEDPDKRNYLVSNEKILAAGFRFFHGLEEGIREAAAAARLVGAEGVKRMRNV